MSETIFNIPSSIRRQRDNGVPENIARAIAEELEIVSESKPDISHLATKEELKAGLAGIKKELITGFIVMIIFQAIILGVSASILCKL